MPSRYPADTRGHPEYPCALDIPVIPGVPTHGAGTWRNGHLIRIPGVPREAKETPAEYLTIELLLSGEADLPAMAVATAVAMTAASCLLSGVIGRREGSSSFSSGIAVFPLPPRSMLSGVGGVDIHAASAEVCRKIGTSRCSQSPWSTSCCLLCHHLHTMS